MSNGGLIGKSNIPTTSRASGVWDLREQYSSELSGTWPKTITDPSMLFQVGDFGGFYDFSDSSTLWQDTGGTTPVTSTGQTILRVDDKSGNGNHLTAQSTPVWNSDGYVTFDGSNDWFSRNISKSIADFTVIGGSRENVRQNGVAYSFVAGTPTTGRLLAHLALGDGNYYFDTYNYTSGRAGGPATVSAGVPLVFSHYRSGSAVTTRTNGSIFRTASISNTISANVIRIGGDTSYYYNGRIYSFFFIDRALSSSEITFVENWMAAKNGAY